MQMERKEKRVDVDAVEVHGYVEKIIIMNRELLSMCRTD